MPHITQQYDPEKGPYLDIFVTKAKSTIFRPEEALEPAVKLRMLIDSGASKTAINPKLALKMGLMAMGKTPLKTASHEILANIYYLDIHCDIFKPPLVMSEVSVVEFPFASGWLDGFLGRDFLKKMLFTMNGPEKQYTLTY